MKKLLAITNARVLGGASSLLLEGDRIAAVGGDVPADAEKLDARGAHIAPGIVDLGVFSVDKRACIAGGMASISGPPAAPNRMASALRSVSNVASGIGVPSVA